jgi:hypothetical protein
LICANWTMTVLLDDFAHGISMDLFRK